MAALKLPHNPVMVMDIFEGRAKGQNIEDELSRTLLVVRQNLVPLGLADYFWIGLDGLRFTWEHKEATELLATMGNRLDDQLRRYTQHADDVGLIWNGVITPGDHLRECFIWNRSPRNPNIMVVTQKSPHNYSELMAYLWRLDKEGITIVNTPDWLSMCWALGSFVYNSLKPEHRTLKRYIKSKPILWEPNPRVETLMGISGANIGEVTAKRILEKHGTPFEWMLSQPEHQDGIFSPTRFREIMKNALGRLV